MKENMATKKLQQAKDVAKHRENNAIWIDHAIVKESDIDWLKDVERLILWNVKLPSNFLAKLPNLWWLDIRGGSSKDLSLLTDCMNIRFFAINQVRGLLNIDEILNLSKVEYIKMYGLSKLVELPTFSKLKHLKRVDVGQMKELLSIKGILAAPMIEELLLIKKIGIQTSDVLQINNLTSLKQFDWIAVDVPMKVSKPVKDAIELPKTKSIHPEEWFGLEN